MKDKAAAALLVARRDDRKGMWLDIRLSANSGWR